MEIMPETTTKSSRQPVQMLDFRREFSAIRNEILDAIAEVCDSQRFILGPQVERFERAAAAACGVPHAAGCASGTDALWLALAALKIGPGDAVVTTPFSFFATVSSILRAGAVPVLADIDPATFNLSAAAVEEQLVRAPVGASRIAAVMPVHLYGQCAEMDAFAALAQRYELQVVEDAAQAFGASWNGVRAGGLGDVAAFSFYPTKNLSAMGDAGMVTTRSAETDERVRMLRTHGMRRRYFHDEIGWNARMDTIQAAVLEVKLKRVDAGNARRREIAAMYDRLFRDAAAGGEECCGWSRAAVDRSACGACVPSVRDSGSAEGCAAGVSCGGRCWIGDLLSAAAAPAGEPGVSWLPEGRFSGERARGG